MKVKSPTGKTMNVSRYWIEVNDRPSHTNARASDSIFEARKIALKFLPTSYVGEVNILKMSGSGPNDSYKKFMICRYVEHPRTEEKKIVFQKWITGKGWTFGGK